MAFFAGTFDEKCPRPPIFEKIGVPDPPDPVDPPGVADPPRTPIFWSKKSIFFEKKNWFSQTFLAQRLNFFWQKIWNFFLKKKIFFLKFFEKKNFSFLNFLEPQKNQKMSPRQIKSKNALRKSGSAIPTTENCRGGRVRGGWCAFSDPVFWSFYRSKLNYESSIRSAFQCTSNCFPSARHRSFNHSNHNAGQCSAGTFFSSSPKKRRVGSEEAEGGVVRLELQLLKHHPSFPPENFTIELFLFSIVKFFAWLPSAF